MPGGYSWMEFAYDDDDRAEALKAQLRFIDAYADPATQEVIVQRWLRSPRPELHVSNGAVLRPRGVRTGLLYKAIEVSLWPESRGSTGASQRRQSADHADSVHPTLWPTPGCLSTRPTRRDPWPSSFDAFFRGFADAEPGRRDGARIRQVLPTLRCPRGAPTQVPTSAPRQWLRRCLSRRGRHDGEPRLRRSPLGGPGPGARAGWLILTVGCPGHHRDFSTSTRRSRCQSKESPPALLLPEQRHHQNPRRPGSLEAVLLAPFAADAGLQHACFDRPSWFVAHGVTRTAHVDQLGAWC